MPKQIDCGKLADEIDELETKQMKLKQEISDERQSCGETQSVLDKFNKKLDSITTIAEKLGDKKRSFNDGCV